MNPLSLLLNPNISSKKQLRVKTSTSEEDGKLELCCKNVPGLKTLEFRK